MKLSGKWAPSTRRVHFAAWAFPSPTPGVISLFFEIRLSSPLSAWCHPSWVNVVGPLQTATTVVKPPLRGTAEFSATCFPWSHSRCVSSRRWYLDSRFMLVWRVPSCCCYLSSPQRLKLQCSSSDWPTVNTRFPDVTPDGYRTRNHPLRWG